MPLDSTLDICHQHLLDDVSQLGAYNWLRRQDQRFAFDQFKQIDHISCDIRWPTYICSYFP